MSLRPKLYCGDKDILPDGYADYGSRYHCLKKGIGVGLNIKRTQNSPSAPPPSRRPSINRDYRDDPSCSVCDSAIRDYRLHMGTVDGENSIAHVVCSPKCATKYEKDQTPPAIQLREEKLKQEITDDSERESLLETIQSQTRLVSELKSQISKLRAKLSSLQSERHKEQREETTDRHRSAVSKMFSDLQQTRTSLDQCKQKLTETELQLSETTNRLNSKLYEQYGKYVVLHEQYINLGNQLIAVQSTNIVDKKSNDYVKRLVDEIVSIKRSINERDDILHSLTAQLFTSLQTDIGYFSELQRENTMAIQSLTELQSQESQNADEISRIRELLPEAKTPEKLESALQQRVQHQSVYQSKISGLHQRILKLEQYTSQYIETINSKLELITNIMSTLKTESENLTEIIASRGFRIQRGDELTSTELQEIEVLTERKERIDGVIREYDSKLREIRKQLASSENRTYSPQSTRARELYRSNPEEFKQLYREMKSIVNDIDPDDIAKEIVSRELSITSEDKGMFNWLRSQLQSSVKQYGNLIFRTNVVMYNFISNRLQLSRRNKATRIAFKHLIFLFCCSFTQSVFIRAGVYYSYSMDLIGTSSKTIPQTLSVCGQQIHSRLVKELTAKAQPQNSLLSLISTPLDLLNRGINYLAFAKTISESWFSINESEREAMGMNVIKPTSELPSSLSIAQALETGIQGSLQAFFRDVESGGVVSLYSESSIPQINIHMKSGIRGILNRLSLSEEAIEDVFGTIQLCSDQLQLDIKADLRIERDRFQSTLDTFVYTFGSVDVKRVPKISDYTEYLALSDVLWPILLLYFLVLMACTKTANKKTGVKITEIDRTYNTESAVKKIKTGLIGVLSQTSVGQELKDNLLKKQQLLQTGDISTLVRETTADVQRAKAKVDEVKGKN